MLTFDELMELDKRNIVFIRDILEEKGIGFDIAENMVKFDLDGDESHDEPEINCVINVDRGTVVLRAATKRLVDQDSKAAVCLFVNELNAYSTFVMMCISTDNRFYAQEIIDTSRAELTVSDIDDAMFDIVEKIDVCDKFARQIEIGEIDAIEAAHIALDEYNLRYDSNDEDENDETDIAMTNTVSNKADDDKRRERINTPASEYYVAIVGYFDEHNVGSPDQWRFGEIVAVSNSLQEAQCLVEGNYADMCDACYEHAVIVTIPANRPVKIKVTEDSLLYEYYQEVDPNFVPFTDAQRRLGMTGSSAYKRISWSDGQTISLEKHPSTESPYSTFFFVQYVFVDSNGLSWSEAGFFDSLEKAENSLKADYDEYNKKEPQYMVIEELPLHSVYPGLGIEETLIYKNMGSEFVKYSFDEDDEYMERIREHYMELHRYG